MRLQTSSCVPQELALNTGLESYRCQEKEKRSPLAKFKMSSQCGQACCSNRAGGWGRKEKRKKDKSESEIRKVRLICLGNQETKKLQ